MIAKISHPACNCVAKKKSCIGYMGVAQPTEMNKPERKEKKLLSVYCKKLRANEHNQYNIILSVTHVSSMLIWLMVLMCLYARYLIAHGDFREVILTQTGCCLVYKIWMKKLSKSFEGRGREGRRKNVYK